MIDINTMQYYVMYGRKISDGPFDTKKDAVQFLIALAGGEYATPEGINNYFCSVFDPGTKTMDLMKTENGVVVDGKFVYFDRNGVDKFLEEECK